MLDADPGREIALHCLEQAGFGHRGAPVQARLLTYPVEPDRCAIRGGDREGAGNTGDLTGYHPVTLTQLLASLVTRPAKQYMRHGAGDRGGLRDTAWDQGDILVKCRVGRRYVAGCDHFPERERQAGCGAALQPAAGDDQCDACDCPWFHAIFSQGLLRYDLQAQLRNRIPV